LQYILSHLKNIQMNQIKNSVQLIGHLGNDVRLTTFDSGAKKAEVSLATTQAYKNAKGELIKDTQWHNIIAWGKTADRMVSSLKKGSHIIIQGAIQYRTYNDKNGIERQRTEVATDSFMVVDKKE
jgi:single-strand DNA-binding protein